MGSRASAQPSPKPEAAEFRPSTACLKSAKTAPLDTSTTRPQKSAAACARHQSSLATFRAGSRDKTPAHLGAAAPLLSESALAPSCPPQSASVSAPEAAHPCCYKAPQNSAPHTSPGKQSAR